MLFHGNKGKRENGRRAATWKGVLGFTAMRAWFESFGGGREARVDSRFFYICRVVVSGLNELGGGAAVIRIDAHADAYADGWHTLIGAQPVLDALRDLLGHAPVRITFPGNGPAGPEEDGEARAASR